MAKKMQLKKLKLTTEEAIDKTLGLKLCNYKEKIKIVNQRELQNKGFGARPSMLILIKKLQMTPLKYKINKI